MQNYFGPFILANSWYSHPLTSRFCLAHEICEITGTLTLRVLQMALTTVLLQNTAELEKECVIACSHRRHGQYKTVLSCPCRRCEHNWQQDKTGLSCLNPVSNLQLFSLKYTEDDWKLGIWKLGRDEIKLIETRWNCLVLSAVVFTPPMRRRQDNLVLHMSAVWTSYKAEV